MSTLLRATARVGLCAFVAFSLYGCQRSRTESQTARVDKLFVPWSRNDSPGCAVGISRNGAVAYEQGYGMANLELGVPITRDTVFAIASITKAFTAMSVMLAVQQGKLSLDDEVQKFIPEWTDRDDHIAVRHLLTHTSGLRDAFGLLGWSDPSTDLSNEAIVRVLARQRGINFPPGSEYQYNNGGYALLAAILRRATGQSLREFADANIFKPLGMTHTHVHDDLPMLVQNRASGYSRNASGWRAAKEDGGIVGNGGMYSTVGDLLRWEANFDNPRVGTPEMFAAMQKPTTLAGGGTIAAGMGLGAGLYRGLRNIGHNGGDYGIATNLTRYPDQRFAVAVLCNIDHASMGGTTTINPEALANSIAEIYLADAFGPSAAASQTSPSPTPVKLSEAELAEKTGLYRAVGRDLPVLVSIDHETLMIRSYYQDDYDFPLTPADANHFVFQGKIPFEFVPSAAGRPKEWHVGPQVLQPVMLVLSAAEIQAYAGAYRSEELGATYTLQPRNTMLLVKSSRADVTMAPFSKDVFVGDGVGIVKFARDSRGTVSSFTLNRDIDRGVRFDRIASSH
jgi:CubicO group peptidase (beta-lactamase class C family)